MLLRKLKNCSKLGTRHFRNVHENTIKWLKLSKESGKQFAVTIDETGGAQHSLLPDVKDSKHDSDRINCLWGSFLAGAWVMNSISDTIIHIQI
jgi:hypothetical protein